VDEGTNAYGYDDQNVRHNTLASSFEA
jgi:hypothetical protein